MVNRILFFSLATFWGGSFVVIKYAIAEIPSFTAAFYRVFFALIFLGCIYFKHFKGVPNFFDRRVFYSSLAGLCSIGIPFSLLFWGERYISASIAGVLNGTVPFWTLLMGISLFRNIKSVTRVKILGLILGFIGISVIFGPKVQLQGSIEEIKGLCALIGMSLFYALGININRSILVKETSLSSPVNLIIQHSISAIFLGILAYFVDGVFEWSLLLKPENGLSIFYLSFISTSLAFIVFFRLIREMGSVEASSVTFFVPAVALILDMITHQSTLTLLESVGTTIIFASMFLLKERKVLS